MTDFRQMMRDEVAHHRLVVARHAWTVAHLEECRVLEELFAAADKALPAHEAVTRAAAQADASAAAMQSTAPVVRPDTAEHINATMNKAIADINALEAAAVAASAAKVAAHNLSNAAATAEITRRRYAIEYAAAYARSTATQRLPDSKRGVEEAIAATMARKRARFGPQPKEEPLSC